MIESRLVAWPTYLVSTALIVVPLSDVATSLYPWRFLDARWRFGAVGLISNALLIPMAGLLVAYLAAVFLEHRNMRRTIGVLSFAGVASCFVALLMFALDALQTRAAVRPEMQLSFNVASIAAAMKTLLACASMLAIGIAAFRGKGRRSEDSAQVPLFKVGATPAQSK